HVHCVVPGGGLSPDHQRWIPSSPKFFLPVKVLSQVFRGKFLDGLRSAFRNKRLAFYGSCHFLENRKDAFLKTCGNTTGWSMRSLRRPGTRTELYGPLPPPR